MLCTFYGSLYVYHSLNVCLRDTWTEDMTRSRSMTLAKTSIISIFVMFMNIDVKVFWYRIGFALTTVF